MVISTKKIMLLCNAIYKIKTGTQIEILLSGYQAMMRVLKVTIKIHKQFSQIRLSLTRLNVKVSILSSLS